MREELPPRDFDAWIRPLQGKYDQARLFILAPNRYVLERLEQDYRARITNLVSSFDVYAEIQGLEFLVGSWERGPGAPARADPHSRDATCDGVTPGDARTGTRAPSLNRSYLFETFVEGKSNEMAKAAACQVAANVGQSYNPLLLYGGVGLGKTHLMHAVGNEILANTPRAKVVYLHSQRFADDMVRGIRTGSIRDIMQDYRAVEVLLIDDIQFFAGKLRSQEEFFHVFNSVLERGHQMVLTCDRYPREIEGLEERLQSRFAGGLTVEVEPPDLETRAAILQRKAEAKGFDLSSDIAFYIAERLRSNVRELEGALQRVIASARFTGHEVTLDFVRDALRDLFAVQNRQVTIDNIQKTVAEYYRVKLSDMLSRRRTRAIARPRQMAMRLAKELTNHSLPEIGERFGGRDHTTVMHACNKIAELRQTDPSIVEDYKNLVRQLNR